MNSLILPIIGVFATPIIIGIIYFIIEYRKI
jgi:hypothetical protein